MYGTDVRIFTQFKMAVLRGRFSTRTKSNQRSSWILCCWWLCQLLPISRGKNNNPFWNSLHYVWLTRWQKNLFGLIFRLNFTGWMKQKPTGRHTNTQFGQVGDGHLEFSASVFVRGMVLLWNQHVLQVKASDSGCEADIQGQPADPLCVCSKGLPPLSSERFWPPKP